jgi:hypothetical protein
MGKRSLAATLGIAVCAAGGCAVERMNAVELVGNVGVDAAATGGDASLDASVSDALDEGDAFDDSPAPSSCDGDAAILVTSQPFGMSDNGQFGDYFVRNNVYDLDAGAGTQTLYACSYHSWYVVSDLMADDAGVVMSYPNSQMNFGSSPSTEPPISSFHTITSTFDETSPHVGVYEDAYDIWLNGVPGDNQIMIWVDNNERVPHGTKVQAATPLDGRTYDVWVTSDYSYIALVSTETFTSGTIDLLKILQWAVSSGWLPADTTLGQIDFGVEIVSTGGASATFRFNDFSITAN